MVESQERNLGIGHGYRDGVEAPTPKTPKQISTLTPGCGPFPRHCSALKKLRQAGVESHENAFMIITLTPFFFPRRFFL